MLPTRHTIAIQRQPISVPAVIANGEALSGVIDLRGASGGTITTPAAWTSAAIAFKVCDTLAGTYVPLRNQFGTLVEITGVVVNAAAAYPLPDELFGGMYFKIWSENAGSDAAQGAARSLVAALKG